MLGCALSLPLPVLLLSRRLLVLASLGVVVVGTGVGVGVSGGLGTPQDRSFSRADLRKMSASQQLELLREKDKECEYCVDQDELRDIVRFLDARDAREGGGKRGFAMPPVEKQEEMRDFVLTTLDSQLRVRSKEDLGQTASNPMLQMVFHMLDHDADGFVSTSEVHTSLDTLLSAALPDHPLLKWKPTQPLDPDRLDDHAHDLAAVALQDSLAHVHATIHASGDVSGDGLLSLQEFCGCFRLLYTATVELFGATFASPVDSAGDFGKDAVPLKEAVGWLRDKLGKECAGVSLVHMMEHLEEGQQEPTLSLGGFVYAWTDTIASPPGRNACVPA